MGKYTNGYYYLKVYSYINNKWASFYVEEPDGSKYLINERDAVDEMVDGIMIML